MKKIFKITAIAAALLVTVPSMAQKPNVKKVDKIEKQNAKMKEMKVALNLTDEQFGEIKEHMIAQQKAMKENRQSTKGEFSKMEMEDKKVAKAKMKLERAELQKQTDLKIKEVLNEEQLVKYEAYKKEQRAKRKEFRKERVEHKPMKEKRQMENAR